MADRQHGQKAHEFRRGMRKLWEAVNAPCAICGQQTIDYLAEAHLPDALELDHIYPVATHPHLEFDPGNVRPTHSRCNRHRGMGRDVAPVGVTSERW